MGSSKGTKLDVIRLLHEDGTPQPKPATKRPAIRKMVIRLLPGLDEHLRAEMRYRGDLQSMILEAINSVDLEKVRLVDLFCETRLSTTSIGLAIPIHSKLKSLAKSRSASMNVLVNTAVAHWLAGKNVIRLVQ